MELEQKINDTFLNRIRKSLTGKVVAYGLATSLAFGGFGLTSCGETSNTEKNYISSTEPIQNCEQKIIYYEDNDGDSYGNPNNNVLACSQPTGYVTNNLDPDDNNAIIIPGCTTSTYYRDNDGDGYGNSNNNILACSQPAGYVTDNTDPNDSNADVYPGCTTSTYYRDNDGDGYGNPNNSILACSQPTGYVTNNTDPNDTNPDIP